MKIFKGTDDNELFMVQIPFKELAEMEISPEMLIHDNETKSKLLKMMFKMAIENNYADPKTLKNTVPYTIRMELETDAVNFHVIKPDINTSLSVIDEMFRSLLHHLDEMNNDYDDEDEIDENTDEDDDITDDESVTVVVEYKNIMDVLNICKILHQYRHNICDLEKSSLFIPNEHNTRNKRYLHIVSTHKTCNDLIAVIYEFSKPINVTPYLTDDFDYDILQAMHNEHYKHINNLTEIAKI